MSGLEIGRGFPEAHRAAVLALLADYQASIDARLCFGAEIEALPGDYAPPSGDFFTAFAANVPIGVAGLRCWDAAARIAEIKRLYVAPGGRGTGAGRRLTEAVIAEARRLGYHALRLDTLPSMTRAQELYRRLGFREIANYNGNPVAGVRFYELALVAAPAARTAGA